MDPVKGIIIAVAISVIPTAISYYLSSRELRKGFSTISNGMAKLLEAMREGFIKMDERFERLAEGQTRILETFASSSLPNVARAWDIPSALFSSSSLKHRSGFSRTLSRRSPARLEALH